MVFLRAKDPHDTAPPVSQYHDYYVISLTRETFPILPLTGAPSKVPTHN